MSDNLPDREALHEAFLNILIERFEQYGAAYEIAAQRREYDQMIVAEAAIDDLAKLCEKMDIGVLPAVLVTRGRNLVREQYGQELLNP